MIGAELPPGRIERVLQSIPEGSILRGVLIVLVTLSLAVLVSDFRALMAAQADTERESRTEPMPLPRPIPGDQIRPYLPRTIPVGPDRGEPKLPGYDGPVDGTAMDRSMEFILAAEGSLTGIGRIDVGTADRFAAFLENSGGAVKRLVLHSPGGSVDDAIAMALLVREKGLDTEVPADGYCASACPLLFAGGVRRTAGAQAWIGLHQVYAVEMDVGGLPRDIDRSISDIQQTIAQCQELLVRMGVEPALWIKAMQTPPEELYVLTEAEMLEFALVTRDESVPPADASGAAPQAEKTPKPASGRG